MTPLAAILLALGWPVHCDHECGEQHQAGYELCETLHPRNARPPEVWSWWVFEDCHRANDARWNDCRRKATLRRFLECLNGPGGRHTVTGCRTDGWCRELAVNVCDEFDTECRGWVGLRDYQRVQNEYPGG